MGTRKPLPLPGPDGDDSQHDATPQGNLTAAQHVAIENLGAGRSIVASAQAAGVHRVTLHRWLTADPHFVAALNAAKRDTIDQWRSELRELGTTAIKTIAALMQSDDTPALVKLRAAMAALAVADGAKLNYGSDDPEVVLQGWEDDEVMRQNLRALRPIALN
jgi:hypothetical protein